MRNKPTTAAFTLAELVMAMCITAVIGLAVTGVAVALSNLHEHGQEFHQRLQTGWVATNRLQATLRRARLITANSTDALVLWAEDTNDDGTINVSEMLSVYRPSGSSQLVERRIVFPSDMDAATRQALDITLKLNDLKDTDVVAAGAATYPQYNTVRVLAENVQDFDVYCDPPAPMTRMVRFRLAIGNGDETVSIQGGATLRADQTAYVEQDGDKYILNTPDGG